MSRAPKKIMVVETDPIICCDLCMILGKMGYVVSSVDASGEKAVEKASEDAPDLVLTEFTLKGRMNGLELAGQMGSRLNIPVILLTADDRVVRSREPEGRPFICLNKPFEVDELKAAIKTIFEKMGGGG